MNIFKATPTNNSLIQDPVVFKPATPLWSTGISLSVMRSVLSLKKKKKNPCPHHPKIQAV